MADAFCFETFLTYEWVESDPPPDQTPEKLQKISWQNYLWSKYDNLNIHKFGELVRDR